LISILIPTLNEADNLPACLASVRWSDDIVVLDSGSTDHTKDIAHRLGATVINRAFDDWSSHQNWALENIQFRHQWVLYLDADERATEALRDELFRIALNPIEQRVAFYCGRRNYFMGRWLRHSFPPGAVLRFFRRGSVRFERLVNPRPVISGTHGYLSSLIDHYNFSKGIGEWVAKHNRYSDFEALEIVRGNAPLSWTALFAEDAVARRAALKALSTRLPARPFLKFAYMYVYRRGFLDGAAGLTYCTLQAMYEYLIVLKARELRRCGRHEAPVS